MISITCNAKAKLIILGSPVKSGLINGDELEKLIKVVWCITVATPDAMTCWPGKLGGPKVGTKQPRHLLLHLSTHGALPDPVPKVHHFLRVAKGKREERAKLGQQSAVYAMIWARRGESHWELQDKISDLEKFIVPHVF